jgi:drug/metabolite transporter (DMT)-like permease
MKNNALKGSLWIALGASSYGMLATWVKMAYSEGFSTAEVVFAQFSLGLAGLFICSLFRKKKPVQQAKKQRMKGSWRLIAAGTSMGLTSICYYKAVQYIPVSVGIVLLMQTVWMGVVLEMILQRKTPGLRKVASVLIILAGTVLATGWLRQAADINWTGVGWGILAAVAYTATMYSSNRVELGFPPLKRSLYMILGGWIIVALVFQSALYQQLSPGIFLRWGILLALFGTILPPWLFTKGMPLTGVGLGAIVAAVEIPVSVLMASVLLGEPVSVLQWVGVLLILWAVVWMNRKGSGK